MKKLIVLIAIITLGCKVEVPAQFSGKALNDTFITLDEKEVTFKEIINKYKGKKVVIDVWASWCKDCIVGMPKVKKLQKEYPDVVFLFLSLDKSVKKWKKGIERFNLTGEHYFMQSGWKGDFGNFLNLDWVPRYLVVDKTGAIQLFKAIKATDKKVVEALKK